MGAFLHSLRVPGGFGERSVFDMIRTQVSHEGELAALTLVGGGNRDGGARAGTGVGQGFSYAHWLTLPC